MKIIQINVVADTGSTGKLCACIDVALTEAGYDSNVFYGRKNALSTVRRYKFGTEFEAAISKIANRAGRLMFASSPVATNRLIKRLKAERPDVVHLHCLNGYCVNIYSLLNYLAKSKIPTVVTHHAEFYYTGNCGHALECHRFSGKDGCHNCPTLEYATGSAFIDRSRKAWRLMRDTFHKFDKQKLVFTAVSPWVKSRSQLSDIVSGFECKVVENGVDTSVFHAIADRKSARALIPDCKDKMVVHVTASFTDSVSAIKGGGCVVELARMMPDVTFVVIASYSTVTGDIPSNLHVYGRAKSQNELAAFYNAADVTLITSKRETFSMVVAESLCCGTPVVGFKAGGPESIAIDGYCSFVESDGGVKALKDSLTEMLEKTFDHNAICAEADIKFSTRSMTAGYMDIYQSFFK